MKQKRFSLLKPLKEEEILDLLKKTNKKGYIIFWYMKKDKEPFTYTIEETKKNAETKIKENKKLFDFINKTKIIKL